MGRVEDRDQKSKRLLQEQNNVFWVNERNCKLQRIIIKFFIQKLDIFVIVYLNNIFIYIDNDEDGHIAII